MKKVIIIALAVATIPVGVFGDVVCVPFTVARHTDTAVTEATMDAALEDINDKIRLDNHDCPDDTPCSVRFFRSGGLGVYGGAGDGLNVITTQVELAAVFSVMTHRCKVVDAVDFCAETFNPSYIGCGRCDDYGFILEDWVGGNVYVHEFGHNVLGCGHRDDCSFNIMHSMSIGDNNSLNALECVGFGGLPYVGLCGEIYDGAGGPLTLAGGPYWVTCNITVPTGQTLTIQAGTEIQFEPGLRITSNGLVTGDGSTNTIWIYSNNAVMGFPTATISNTFQIDGGGQLILD